jgi:hypothetical protein
MNRRERETGAPEPGHYRPNSRRAHGQRRTRREIPGDRLFDAQEVANCALQPAQRMFGCLGAVLARRR